jgi:hypothetical protein
MSHPDRRSFLSRLAALGAVVGFGTPAPVSALTTVTNDPWVARVKGKHRVVFHSHMPTEALAIRWAQTFLDTQKNSYGVSDQDCTVIVGLNGRSIGWFFNDALWAKYPTIGDVMGAPGSTRNPQSALIATLVPRQVILLACANSIRASGSRFLPTAERTDAAKGAAFAADVRANLVAGVEVVPSMVVTLQQAQDQGCRYVYAGG